MKETILPGKAAPVRRHPGRPKIAPVKGEASGVGRDGLIEATIAMLKTVAPGEITPSAVARVTGVHPSLIRYYFKTRASLLVAVADRMMQQVGAQLEAAAAQTDGSPRSRLFARIAAIIELNDRFPNFHQLMVSEIAGSEDPLARALIAQATRGGIGAYGTIVSAGLADGSFRDLDPALLYVVVVGIAEFLPAARRQLEIAQGQSVDEAELRRQYIDFACDLILNGIAAKAPAKVKAAARTPRVRPI